MSTTLDAPSRPEIEEALANLVATLHRMPSHWTERRGKLHAQIDIDGLLDEWVGCE